MSGKWYSSLDAVDAVLWTPKRLSSRLGVTPRVLLVEEGVSDLVLSLWRCPGLRGPLVRRGLGTMSDPVQAAELGSAGAPTLLMVSVEDRSDWKDGLRMVTCESVSQWS